MPKDDIASRHEEGIATITLNRPDKLNAMTMEMIDRLIEAFDRAEEDDGVRAVVVTGTGRAFCAGTDLSAGFALPTGGDPRSGEGVPPDVGGLLTLRLFDMRKPVIGAVNGVAAASAPRCSWRWTGGSP